MTSPPSPKSPTLSKTLVKHTVDELADLEIKRIPNPITDFICKLVSFALPDSPSKKPQQKHVNVGQKL